MNPASIIPTITALARAGAAVQAWRLFDAHGLAGADDPAAQALHGRLLKDKALAATGAERRALAAQAAAAYLASARLRPATYPLVNAATLALIAGDAAGAAVMAGEVLALMEVAPEPDTPWWQAATRAEALLLMVDEAGARAALADAMALAPLAWEDHAVTLRQFATIIAEQGGDAAWLEPLRPPRSLHFTGAMRLGEAEPALAARIDAIIAAENIGFGFGALAAGADLLVAERLLAAGAELHIVLPGGEAAFRARSVTPFGARRQQALGHQQVGPGGQR
ncbi:tetratricopeptide repeat-containing protein, partial [Sandarakinorhabdus sp.]|uniref:tetratricopeptide repeat-containing protein n=1 Tax=Sandarakinorhabdus sp. TaxID=1916663 RepID=UPI0038F7B9DC